MKKQIIATGLSGLVGSRIRELLKDKFEFINFSLDSGIDITNFSLLKKEFQRFPSAVAVLHLAAFTDVNRAWEQRRDKRGLCYRVNVLGTKNIAQLCQQTNKYLIHISTDFVFDGNKGLNKPYIEKDKPNPIEWYGQTKLWAEQEVVKSGSKDVILRIAFPFKSKRAAFGFEPIEKLDLVRKIKKQLELNKPLKMFSDQIITPTFIDDISQVVEYCLNNEPQGIFHCVGSTSISSYDLAMKISAVFHLNKSLIKRTLLADFLAVNKSGRPRQKVLAITNKKLKREFNIKMLFLDKALDKMKRELV